MMRRFVVCFAIACGSSPPSGTVTISGTAPNELEATAIASYAYGGGISANNAKELRAVTISFYDHAETSCDGPYVGLDAGEQVVDVADITVVLPEGKGLDVGGDIPLESYTAMLATAAVGTAPPAAVASFQFTTATSHVISSSISGTLTLTHATSGRLTGTITADMGTLDVATETVSVTFDAPACSSLW